MIKKVLILAVMFISSNALCVTLIAKKDTKAFKSANKNSEAVRQIKKGDKVEAEERAGMYWVTGDGTFLSILDFSPSGGSESVAGAIKSVIKSVKPAGQEIQNIRQRSATMGVRGLREDEDVANASNIRPDIRGVLAMESYSEKIGGGKALEKEIFKEIEMKAAE